jgi:hypothetical protein
MPERVLERCRGHLPDEVIARLRARGAALDDRHAERVAFDGADWAAVGAKPLPGLGDARV